MKLRYKIEVINAICAMRVVCRRLSETGTPLLLIAFVSHHSEAAHCLQRSRNQSQLPSTFGETQRCIPTHVRAIEMGDSQSSTWILEHLNHMSKSYIKYSPGALLPYESTVTNFLFEPPK